MDASRTQPLILAPEGRLARFHVFELATPDADPRAVVSELPNRLADESAVLGVGQPLAARLGAELPGLRAFPALTGPGVAVPSTQGALLLNLAGDDRGVLFHRSRALQRALAPLFTLQECVDAFIYRNSRDLSGYEDGTENPKDDAAIEAAVVQGRGEGLDGGSFIAVQRWVHDFAALDRMSPQARDFAVGRSLADNEELDDAPPSAHVKRSAQESFSPEAFMLRRSMPYVSAHDSGLYFVAYGESLDRYERVLYRMLGLEDGTTDALFGFTRPRSGGYYFCPPVRAGRLDLRVLLG